MSLDSSPIKGKSSLCSLKWFPSDSKKIPNCSPSDFQVIPKWFLSDSQVIPKWFTSDFQVIPKWIRSDFQVIPKRFPSDSKMIPKWFPSEQTRTPTRAGEREELRRIKNVSIESVDSADASYARPNFFTITYRSFLHYISFDCRSLHIVVTLYHILLTRNCSHILPTDGQQDRWTDGQTDMT